MDTSTRIIFKFIESELNFKIDEQIMNDLSELYKLKSLSSTKVKLITAYIEGQNFGTIYKLISILRERWMHQPELIKEIDQLEQFASSKLLDINRRITEHKSNLRTLSHL